MDGLNDGFLDGSIDGLCDGRNDGLADGFILGALDGLADGSKLGEEEGKAEGASDGALLGTRDGIELGLALGARHTTQNGPFGVADGSGSPVSAHPELAKAFTKLAALAMLVFVPQAQRSWPKAVAPSNTEAKLVTLATFQPERS